MWCLRKPEAIAKAFSSNLQTGLSFGQVAELKNKFGKNEIPHKGRNIFVEFLKQFKNPLAMVLLFAGFATLFLKEFENALVIFTALFLNVFISWFQQEKAVEIFSKLKKAQKQKVIVKREGKYHEILAEELVCGDIVSLSSGMHTPADIRLISSRDMLVNESALTGEWLATEKDANFICKDNASYQVVEQKNMLFKGTVIVAGEGEGIVVAVGKDTHIGKLATETENFKTEKTPFEKEIAHIAHVISFAIFFILLLTIILGVAKGESLFEMVLTAIALGVASVPEGLPAISVAILAIGAQRLLKKGGLLKNLSSSETLGSVSVILTDKTGTLTEGVMQVGGVVTAKGFSEVNEIEKIQNPLFYAFEASDAKEVYKNGKKQISGRPIEKAIVEKATSLGFENEFERIDFSRFSADRRYAISLNKTAKGNILILSGSPEHILDLSTHYGDINRKEKLTEGVRKCFKEQQESFSQKGARLIGVGFAETELSKIDEKTKRGEIERVVFVGFIALSDKVRADVPQALKEAKSFGVRVIMLTGDHKETARFVAYTVGILKRENERIYTGADIEKMTDKELIQILNTTSVFARVLPKDKMKIARLLKSQGEIVAMTGDGINDAPALKAADIGIAVGSGTDTAKSASDLILLKDSFSIIVEGIKEGRRIRDNVRKTTAYLLSGSFLEVFAILGALLVSLPIPLLPAQLIWHNIISGGLTSFAFAFEKREGKKTDKNSKILTPEILKLIVSVSLISGVLLFTLYLISVFVLQKPIAEARSLIFATLTTFTIISAFSFRKLNNPVFKISLFGNKYLLLGVFSGLFILYLVFVSDSLSALLSLTDFPADDIFLTLAFTLINILSIEALKWLFLRKSRV